jgi:hypothetical protein
VINSHSEVRREIDRELDQPLSDLEWAQVETQGYLLKRIQGGLTSVGIAETIKQWRNAVLSNRVAPDLSTKDRPERERQRGGEAPSSARIFALSVLVAQRAAQDASVREFRQDHLKDGFLKQDDIVPWILRMAELDGPSTLHLKISVPPGTSLDIDALGGIVPSHPIVTSKQHPARSSSQDLLDYPGPAGWVARIPVRGSGVLDRLRILSEELSRSCTWMPAQATAFVLTNEEPAVVPLVCTVRKRSIPALSRIELTIDPAMSPRELSEAYRKLRSQVVGRRHRNLTVKHSTLAVFRSSRPPGETFEKSRREWNKKYPKWRYRAASTFGTHCAAALRRLLDPGQVSLSGLLETRKMTIK